MPAVTAIAKALRNAIFPCAACTTAPPRTRLAVGTMPSLAVEFPFALTRYFRFAVTLPYSISGIAGSRAAHNLVGSRFTSNSMCNSATVEFH